MILRESLSSFARRSRMPHPPLTSRAPLQPRPLKDLPRSVSVDAEQLPATALTLGPDCRPLSLQTSPVRPLLLRAHTGVAKKKLATTHPAIIATVRMLYEYSGKPHRKSRVPLRSLLYSRNSPQARSGLPRRRRHACSGSSTWCSGEDPAETAPAVSQRSARQRAFAVRRGGMSGRSWRAGSEAGGQSPTRRR